ncbi:MAG TPA: TetR/AcrR family transcriptional regulator [Sphingobacteriaceae bacterium]
MDLRDHILSGSDHLFCQNGIKSVTMDDIAKHLGMSKKTIYQYFKDKNELVCILIKNKLEDHICGIDKCFADAENSIEEIFKAVEKVCEMFRHMNPMLFYDLQKYHSEAWNLFQQFRNDYLYKLMQRNLARGISDGLYRSEIDIDVMAKLRIEQIDLVFSQKAFPPSEYHLVHVMTHITEHFLYGISTLKGQETINNYKKHTED